MKIDTDEIEYLKETQKIINDEINAITKVTNNYMDNINNIKKEFYENKAEYKELEISSKLTEINHNVDYVNRKIDNIKQLEESFYSPYFGRIDFNKEKIYIGIKSIINEDTNYVYDWRAPISSMYYNYEMGVSEYKSNEGLIKDVISLKRQYKIENGILLRCINTSDTIDDDFLQEILSNSNDKMKNIVSTIQKDQNKIIRNSSDKYLIVQGFAGSGKTSVALHRIAYLLYKDTNLKSNNILILSPNDVFTKYISNVLPELGESNVKNITFSKFVIAILHKIKNIEKLSEFISRTYHSVDETIKYKLSDKFIEDMDIFFENYISN
ncbi:MAG: UvrD-helicase domain-containing protein, partial [Bacilli bacterium]